MATAQRTTAAQSAADEVGAIYRLIPLIMQDVGAVKKDRKSGDEPGSRAPKYAFRGIDDMYNAIQPALIKHGVFVTPTVTAQVREQRPTRGGGVLNYTILTVCFTFFAADGSSFDVTTVGEAMDTSDKSSNKAQSAAMKYALMQVLCIPTEGDNDTENSNLETVRANVRELLDLMNMVKVPEALVRKWLKRAGVERVEDMPDEAVNACVEYVRKKLPGNQAAP